MSVLFSKTFSCSYSTESNLSQTNEVFNNSTPTQLSVCKRSLSSPSELLFHSPLSMCWLFSLASHFCTSESVCLFKHVFSFKQYSLITPTEDGLYHSFLYCLRLLSLHVSVSYILCYELLKGRDHILDFFALCFTYNMDYFNDYYGNNSGDTQLGPFTVPA